MVCERLWLPVHRWWCQKYEESWLGLACIATDGPLELVEDTKHPHCNLRTENQDQYASQTMDSKTEFVFGSWICRGVYGVTIRLLLP